LSQEPPKPDPDGVAGFDATAASPSGRAAEQTAELRPGTDGHSRSAESSGGAELLHAGETVAGRFTILRFVARGGMGEVYEAQDEVLRAHVALKTILPHFADNPMALERFRREVLLARKASHPNVCRIYDMYSTQTASGEPLHFLTMEFLDGETLQQRLRRKGRMSTVQVLPLLRQMAAALDAAHAAGVVHRDFKTSNVMLVAGETAGRVSAELHAAVTDFGIARALQPVTGSAEGVTGTGLLGTPEAMAPEQVTGGEVGPAADIYALGLVLYEMLTGKTAFAGATPLETVFKRVNEPPPAPKQTVPDLDERWNAGILRCLERDPSRRFATASDVEGFVVGLVPKVRRRGLVPVALASVVLALVATAWFAGGFKLLGRGRPEAAPGAQLDATPRSVAVLPFANLSGDPSQDYFADGMTEEITGKLSRLKGLSVVAGSSVAKYRKAPSGPKEVGAELGVAHVLEGSVRKSGNRIRVTARLVNTADAARVVWAEDFDATLDDIFDVQKRVATRIVEALGVQLTPVESKGLTSWGTRNAAAYDEYLRGLALDEHFSDREKLEDGRRHFERALEMDPNFAPAKAGIGDAEVQIYRNFDPDPIRLERAEAAAQRALVLDPHLSIARITLAAVKANRFDYVGAVEVSRQVVADDEQNYLGWDRLCWVLGYVEPPEAVEAERACRRSLEINPGYGEAYYHLVRALALQGRDAEARGALAALKETASSKLASPGQFWISLAAGRSREALDVLLSDASFRPTALAAAGSAMAHAQLGEADLALNDLDVALQRGYRDVGSLRRSRWYEPLRKDPRFDALLARHGIPAQ
jgi:eukaryotic-like serine/threonine-protein kinase